MKNGEKIENYEPVTLILMELIGIRFRKFYRDFTININQKYRDQCHIILQ